MARRRWLLATGVGAVLVAGGLGWIVSPSSLLAVREVEVAGQSRVSREAVVRAAAVPVGLPLARVDVAAVRQRVAALRVVESADVRRRWPSTLRITVDERLPIAAVPRGGGYVLLDADGVRVSTASAPPQQLPVVRIDAAAAGSGSAAAGRATTAADRAALHVLESLPRRLAGKVHTVSVAGDSEVRLRLDHGATVIWGRPERGQEKARILTVLLRRDNANTYNVSSPEVVTTG